MKRVFLIHGWDGDPENHWFPWFKKELEKKMIKVIAPSMPNTSEPKIKEWVEHIKQVVGKLDQDTCFVGHSIGCQAIMRYLEKENYNGKVGNIVFVAGWFKLENLESENEERIAEPWMKLDINFERIKEKMSKLTVFISDDEPYGCVEENKSLFEKELNAKVVIMKKKGHFTIGDGVKELPEVLKEL